MVVFIQGVGGAGMYWCALTQIDNRFRFLDLLDRANHVSPLLCVSSRCFRSIDMIFAPALKDKFGNECGGIDDGGGSMLNGYAEPEAYISLAAGSSFVAALNFLGLCLL